MIQRFEDEYPETKIPDVPLATSPPETSRITSLGSSIADASVLSASLDSNHLSLVASSDDNMNAEENNENPHSNLNRTTSETSLAAKAYTNEEGRMHRFGQGIRRELLRPTGTNDFAHGTSESDELEPGHLNKLRRTLEELEGEEIRERVEREGGQKVMRELGVSAKELAMLEREDPEGFERFKGAQVMALLNSGVGWDEAQRMVGDVNGSK